MVLEAVSYTHLDVYKRQVLEVFHNLSSKINLEISYLSTIFKIIGIAYLAEFGAQVCRDAGAVSYTHLDVYKRQELEEYVEVMDEDLADLEDDVYEDGLEEEIDFCEIECPECGEMVYVDMDMLDEENKIICPNCEEEIDIDLSCCCDDDHDQCDCH